MQLTGNATASGLLFYIEKGRPRKCSAAIGSRLYEV